MPRVKSGVAHHARKKKYMEAAKGARGGRSKLYKAAKETVERGMRYAYRDRRKRKSDFRALWITRINAAARLHGLSYSRLMAGSARPASISTGRSWPISRSETRTRLPGSRRSPSRIRSAARRAAPGRSDLRHVGPSAGRGWPHERISPRHGL